MTEVIKSWVRSASGSQPVGLDPLSPTLPREKAEKQALAQATRPVGTALRSGHLANSF